MPRKRQPPTVRTIYLNVVETIRISLDDYKVTTEQIRLGEVDADEREAGEKAAVQFKQHAPKLMAVRCDELCSS
jgi:hypothetical protein